MHGAIADLESHDSLVRIWGIGIKKAQQHTVIDGRAIGLNAAILLSVNRP